MTTHLLIQCSIICLYMLYILIAHTIKYKSTVNAIISLLLTAWLAYEMYYIHHINDLPYTIIPALLIVTHNLFSIACARTKPTKTITKTPSDENRLHHIIEIDLHDINQNKHVHQFTLPRVHKSRRTLNDHMVKEALEEALPNQRIVDIIATKNDTPLNYHETRQISVYTIDDKQNVSEYKGTLKHMGLYDTNGVYKKSTINDIVHHHVKEIATYTDIPWSDATIKYRTDAFQHDQDAKYAFEKWLLTYMENHYDEK